MPLNISPNEFTLRLHQSLSTSVDFLRPFLPLNLISLVAFSLLNWFKPSTTCSSINLLTLVAIQRLLGADEGNLVQIRCADCLLSRGVLPSERAAIVSWFLPGIC